MPSLTQIFSERAEYLPDVTHQIEKMRGDSALPILGEDPIKAEKLYRVDWRRYSIKKLHQFQTPVILLTGWGSGWEGILPLGFSMACEGYEVYHISLPGYGSSQNPPKEYYRTNYYQHAAQTIKAFCDRIETGQVYLVGHSMGAEILANVAWLFPDLVKKLVLLNPSGVHQCGFFQKPGLVWRFGKSGAVLRKEYQGLLQAADETDYIQPLIDWCGKQQSPWGLGRISQRRYEFRAICEGTLTRILRLILVPIVFVSGERDTVFSAEESGRTLRSAAVLAPSFESSILAGVHHNPTLFHSEIAAAAIAHYLEG